MATMKNYGFLQLIYWNSNTIQFPLTILVILVMVGLLDEFTPLVGFW